MAPGQRRCTVCGTAKPSTDFYRDVKGRDGLQSACKACHRHRVRAYRDRLRERNGDRVVAPGTKRCGRCGLERPTSHFHRNRSTPDGLHWVCAECNRDPASRVPIERRRTIRNYDLTRDEFDRMRVDQGDRCAICRRRFVGTPHIDHDHDTGQVRGLLCRGCNVGLGNFRDDPERLGAAIAYLLQGRTPPEPAS